MAGNIAVRIDLKEEAAKPAQDRQFGVAGRIFYLSCRVQIAGHHGATDGFGLLKMFGYILVKVIKDSVMVLQQGSQRPL